jgi:hypothetical protein
MELKKLPFEKESFVAYGTTYMIKYSLTVARWQEFEKLQNHFGFGLTFTKIVGRLNDAITFANQGKGVEAWDVIFNIKEGIAYNLEGRTHPALLMLTLFIVTDKEDLTAWTEEGQKKKIEDWNKEGYDINDFFVLASNLVTGFLPIYEEISQSISQKVKTRKSGTGKRPLK